mmetsp:Transcript_3611/g.6741  ORF Transcript_3611/g.6741 Transcript_3611/m.6741 type:complete len:220 (-) Transcript_3611:1699-2358(-)
MHDEDFGAVGRRELAWHGLLVVRRLFQRKLGHQQQPGRRLSRPELGQRVVLRPALLLQRTQQPRLDVLQRYELRRAGADFLEDRLGPLLLLERVAGEHVVRHHTERVRLRAEQRGSRTRVAMVDVVHLRRHRVDAAERRVGVARGALGVGHARLAIPVVRTAVVWAGQVVPGVDRTPSAAVARCVGVAGNARLLRRAPAAFYVRGARTATHVLVAALSQ